MKKTFLILAGILSTTSQANAQSSIFTGDFTLSAEIGGAMPLNRLDQTLIENRFDPDDELLSADTLNFGHGLSGEVELKAGLSFGGNAFVRIDGMSASADDGLDFTEDGRVTGFHATDGFFIIGDEWNPESTVDTEAFSLAIGYEREFGKGFTGSVGLIAARVSQDLLVTYDFSPETDGAGFVELLGEGDNMMGGLVVGIGYERELGSDWSLGLSGSAAVMANRYDFRYTNNLETDTSPRQEAESDGNSTVIRLDAEAKAIYNFRPDTKLTGAIGVTKYSGLSTGLENMLNEDNNTSDFDDVTSDVTFTYARVGVQFAF